MNTVELKRLRATRFRAKLRHLSPALIGLGTFVVVLIAATLWWSPWFSSSVSQAQATAPEIPANTPLNPAYPPNSNSQGIATASHSSPSTVPSEGASLPEHGATSPRHGSPLTTSAHAPRKTVPTATSAPPPVPAPKVQKHTPEGLDLDTPMAPPVH
jgi:hypothetical protein